MPNNKLLLLQHSEDCNKELLLQKSKSVPALVKSTHSFYAKQLGLVHKNSSSLSQSVEDPDLSDLSQPIKRADSEPSSQSSSSSSIYFVVPSLNPTLVQVTTG